MVSFPGGKFKVTYNLTVGTQYDRLAVTSAASLDGDLTVSLINAFLPSPADTFMILTAGSVSGAFDNTPGGVLAFPGGTFNVTYNANSVVLSNFQSIPEPGTLALGLCGAAMLVFCARRARR